jgi:hypothetical protein
MTIDVIQLDETQKTWVLNENETSNYKAAICDYKDINDVEYDDCIDAVVLTATGYEAWATYFSGATVTEIEIDSPF